MQLELSADVGGDLKKLMNIYDFSRLRLTMRAYCKEATKFGDQLCPQGAAPRHVTVIMNSHTKGRFVEKNK